MLKGKKKDSGKVLQKVENDTLRKALREIESLEYSTIPKGEVRAQVDYEMTVKLIRERARLALGVVDGIRKEINDD